MHVGGLLQAPAVKLQENVHPLLAQLSGCFLVHDGIAD